MSPKILLGKKFKAGKFKVYLIRLLCKVLSFPFTFFRESKLKHSVRSFILNYQNSLPIELAISKGDIAIQIGTPRPRTVRRFLKAVGSTGTVVVLEAEPNNYSRLHQSGLLQKYSNLILIEGAAWSSSKDGELSISPYSGDHKIAIDEISVDNDLRAGNDLMQVIYCKFYALDDLFNELGIPAINYLSVTVNGAELEVLKGAGNLLKNSPHARVFAKGHSMHSSGKILNELIINYLNQLGFKSKLTKGELSSTTDKQWLERAGDVYAWKT